MNPTTYTQPNRSTIIANQITIAPAIMDNQMRSNITAESSTSERMA